jgi:hypothetical protein
MGGHVDMRKVGKTSGCCFKTAGKMFRRLSVATKVFSTSLVV